MASNTEQAKVEVLMNGQKANATMKEIEAAARMLNAELRKLPTNSQEFTDKSKEWQKVTDRLTQVRNEARGTGDALEKMNNKAGDESFFGKVKSNWMMVAGAWTAAAAAGAGVISFFKDAVEGAMADERAETKLRYALNGNAKATQQLLKFKERMMQTTLFSEDEIMGAVNMGIAMGRTESQTQKMVETAMGLARVTGRDLNDLMMALSATYEGQTGKLGKLAGELKGLTEAEIRNGGAVDILNEKYGKFSKEGLDTVEGKMAQIKKLWEEFKDSLGAKVLPVVGQFLTDVAGSAEDKLQLEISKREKAINEARDAINKSKGKTFVGTSAVTVEQAMAMLGVQEQALGKLRSELRLLENKKLLQESVDKLASSKANLDTDLKSAATKYYGPSGSDKDQAAKIEKLNKELDVARKKAQEAFDELVKESDKLGKQYAETLLTGEDTIATEAQKNAAARYKFKIDMGIATADEIMQYEMDAIIRTKEFAESSAQEQAAIIATVYERALAKSAKSSPIKSGAVSGENQDLTFDPGFDSSTSGTPLKVGAPDTTGDKLSVWGSKAQEVIQYAQTVMDILGEVESMMTESENRAMAKDEESNNVKKANLKKQLDGKVITQKQYDAQIEKLDKELDVKKRKLLHDQAVREKEMRMMSAIINTAAGVTSAFVSPGGVAGVILAALIGLLGIYQIATIANTPVPQAARGRYNVIGEEDGKSYSAEWGGRSRTGIYDRPTLISEMGPELVVDAPTTRNIQMNHPWILSAINYSRVPQMADGNYPGMGGGGLGSGAYGANDMSQLSTGINELNANLRNGIRSFVVYDDVRDAASTVNEIENNVKIG